MVHRHRVTTLFLAGMAAFMAMPALAVTLTYRADNKWVAEQDNTPLRQLMQAAKKGQMRFTVSAPAQNRPLAVQRLLILKGILEREAGNPVIMEESGAPAKPNTLVIK